ncbi:hypothetical protein N781_09590 [Pontibacillus halophilus JSM 076056 = DSM 19796]|uniref:Uncharacterized protein n=1 Tax=Pontibacillus halophilus JSM 076056 = DSM 19796 TaxID=1385510 RepID=A0A0A5G6K8_9BACI|nr:hypothetical protein [Pontibacillus halophilus]KGX88761.1 hypothetical protein N781_09590 [Pontibacillus halophilus JSM 076056 = DSM 19796]
MDSRKFLLLIILLMHVATLVNITVFDSEWNGLLMAWNTILFIAAIALVVPQFQRSRG